MSNKFIRINNLILNLNKISAIGIYDSPNFKNKTKAEEGNKIGVWISFGDDLAKRNILQMDSIEEAHNYLNLIMEKIENATNN